MEELSTLGGKLENLEWAGGPPYKRRNIRREYGRNSQVVGGLGTGRSLCWWMAVRLGRGQITGQHQKITAKQ